MQRRVEIFAPAKINLTLDVVGKRDDGYHLVEMVMQSISLGDRVAVMLVSGKDSEKKIRVFSSEPELLDDESNLAYRAAELFFTSWKKKDQDRASSFLRGSIVEISIQKNIPLAAGLAGGSTDAASVLKALNLLGGKPFTMAELLEMGAKLGADVPFCIKGGTALATGIGTMLQELPAPPEKWLVLIKPDFPVSTRRVYGHLEWRNIKKHPATGNVISSLKNGEFPSYENMVNVLEEVTFNLYPQLHRYKSVLEEAKFEFVLMSGSGPTLLGFVPDKEQCLTKASFVTGLLKKRGLQAKVATAKTVGKDFQA